MVNWKRSGGKARNGGQNLFINKFSDEIIRWGRMGLKFTEPTSIASVRAYEALPLSAIFTHIKVKPEEILIVDDYKSNFEWEMANTWLDGDTLKTENDNVIESNSIWDGEGLVQVDIIDNNELIKDKGVILTRQRQMKSALFGCYIDKYFQQYFGENYETAKVYDMYSNELNAKNIKIITTPSAIKMSKNNEDIMKEYPEYGEYGSGAWLQYWKDNVTRADGYIYLGVCKTEKPSHNCIFSEDGKILTYRNVLSYQHINTIPFTKDEINTLLQTEIEHINRLKNDLNYFLHEIKVIANTDFSQELGYDEDTEDLSNQELNIGLNIDITDAFLKLVQKRPAFADTQVFKDYRRNYIDGYIRQLRRGKLHLNDTDYAIACGNPIQLLQHSLGIFDANKELSNEQLKDNELYCSRFDNLEDGTVIIGFRNPHVVYSNVGIQKLKKDEEIKVYMRCTPNIVFLNSIKYPILSTYSGEDYDIDCNLLTIESIVCKAAQRIDDKRFLISHNDVKASRNDDLFLTNLNMAQVDHTISKNAIGDVINLSMECNSKINNLMYRLENKIITDENEIKIANEQIKQLFKLASRLNVCSMVEIDKAKKSFDKLDVNKELGIIKKEFIRVDEEKIKDIENKIDSLDLKINELLKEINKEKDIKQTNETSLNEKSKELSKELSKITRRLNINSNPKLSVKEVEKLKKEYDNLKIESDRSDGKENKKISKKLTKIKKQINEDLIPKLTNEEVVKMELKKQELIGKINEIKNYRINEVNDIKSQRNNLLKLKFSYDNRRIKPYFFKYIGENATIKKRKKTNKKHRKELDKQIIAKYCEEKSIDIDSVDMSSKEIKVLLKQNDKIQEEWENSIYDKTIETPMNWLNLIIDESIETKNPTSTIPVISLVKVNKNKCNEEKTTNIVNMIHKTNIKIKDYRANKDIEVKEKKDKVRIAKDECVKYIRDLKPTKADIYQVLKICLTKVCKNGKVKETHGIESITLEILFSSFGDEMLKMFI